MQHEQNRQIIEKHNCEDGLTETGIAGVRLFRAARAIPCIPAVYEPSVAAICAARCRCECKPVRRLRQKRRPYLGYMSRWISAS